MFKTLPIVLALFLPYISIAQLEDSWYLESYCYPRAMSDEMKELAQMLHNTCVGETGVSEDLIEKVNSAKTFADDENLKCYIKCLMAQMACIDDDGIIDVEATIAVLPEEIQQEADPIIRSCGTKVGKTACENAWLTHKCYAENFAEYMLI
ncbi:general odorant-binding protein 69a-like isoform X2 [Rhynchophorus ferrugineus]|uniref:general odorant-binding protein 69a-like isoform X2 n=1 Tax=Rhynchophorus ferrugineus TaxID=354439 RepID=UPI003FCCA7FD